MQSALGLAFVFWLVGVLFGVLLSVQLYRIAQRVEARRVGSLERGSEFV
jgi:hypothetical protein